MSVFDRALLALYTLFLSVVLLAVAAAFAGWNEPFRLADRWVSGLSQMEAVGALSVVILAGFRLFWVSIIKTEEKGRQGRFVVLQEGETGQIRVSVQAMESLAVKAASGLSGIKEVNPQLYATAKGVSLKIRVAVAPDVNIPELSEQLQNLVKKKILEVTGVTVFSVKITVESITASKPRIV